jgi:alkanesulfonate monooxygenase SsuD/methylene tetrahydromethanopterin reductase-like flavin-dependent oxidoreductase (luciferase family)
MPRTTVQAGIYLPSDIAEAGRPGAIVAHARQAEDVGLESVWLGDHLISRDPRLDSPLLAAAIAATTETIKIGFGVLILPLRPVAWVAKEVATLQILSGNRLLLGIGSGGLPHGDAAWRAVGLDFRQRGRQTDSALEVLPSLVAGKPTVVGGDAGEEVTLAPGAEMPPVLIAGSEPTFDRIARYADGWYPAFTSPAVVAAGLRRLTTLAAEHGRPTPGVTLNVAFGLGDVPAAAIDAYVRGSAAFYGGDETAVRAALIAGPPAEAAEQIAALAQAGVDRIVGYPIAGNRSHQAELLAEATRLANANA